MIICDECETVAHCTKHGCIPKQPLGCVNHDCAKCKAQPAPVQEPFMWVCNSLDETVWETSKHKECEHCIPLYTTPPAAQPAPVQEPIKPDTLSLEQLLRAAVYWGATYAKGDYHDALEGKIYQWISLRSGATPPAAPPALVQQPATLDEMHAIGNGIMYGEQPAPVPDKITDNSESPDYRDGWNDCRELMLSWRNP